MAKIQHTDQALPLTLLPTAPAGAQSWLGDSPKLLSCWTKDVHLLLAPLSEKDGIHFLKRNQGTLEKWWMGEHRACDAGF